MPILKQRLIFYFLIMALFPTEIVFYYAKINKCMDNTSFSSQKYNLLNNLSYICARLI